MPEAVLFTVEDLEQFKLETSVFSLEDLDQMMRRPDMIRVDEHERMMQEMRTEIERINQLLLEALHRESEKDEKIQAQDEVIASQQEMLATRNKMLFGPESEKTTSLYKPAETEDETESVGTEPTPEADEKCTADLSAVLNPDHEPEPEHCERTKEGLPSRVKSGSPKETSKRERKSRSTINKMTAGMETRSRFFKCQEEDLPEQSVPGKWKHNGWKERRSVVIDIPKKRIVEKQYTEEMIFIPDEVLSEEDGDRDVLRAEAVTPLSLLPGGNYSAESAALDVFEHYGMFIPYNRSEFCGNVYGYPVSRSTVATRLCECAERHLVPVYNTMHKLMLMRDIIHADETPAQVLLEPGKKASSLSYMWIYVSGDDGLPRICIYDYAPGRSHEYPEGFLAGFNGILCTDSFGAYNHVDMKFRVKCAAHLRRKFFDAIPRKLLQTKEGHTLTNAEIGFFFCNQMFYVERLLKDKDPAQRKELREKWLRPVLDDFYAWISTLSVSSGSALEKAVTYAVNNKEEFYNVLKDGRLHLDNNCAERMAKMYALYRKNSLFHCSVRGAESAAVYQSLIATARANGINVYLYLYALFCFMPAKASDEQFIQNEMLPWCDRIKRLCTGPVTDLAIERIRAEAEPLLIQAHRDQLIVKREYREAKERANCLKAFGYPVTDPPKKPAIPKYEKSWKVSVEKKKKNENSDQNNTGMIRIENGRPLATMRGMFNFRKKLDLAFEQEDPEGVKISIITELEKAVLAASIGKIEGAAN